MGWVWGIILRWYYIQNMGEEGVKYFDIYLQFWGGGNQNLFSQVSPPPPLPSIFKISINIKSTAQKFLNPFHAASLLDKCCSDL